ncbi:peptidase C14, caspase catalytic subunit P20 [Segniliparus rotundus DSM 44985]|uniref:Peptidase C14, caspase catalytic subunit P20 n=2 Tax=Segniliparus rotundus TaxID=286802 RepID=D6ZAV6_SEGRD|nr:peptidase C14, caspase catalytic subunit P20 [Segniliparus rotundus DSM 44985]
MGAAALAPPPMSTDHTPWSAADPNRVAPSGHFLGASGTGAAGVRDGYLLAGADPDQGLLDEAVARASALAGSLDAARAVWGLPPTGSAVAVFKDEGGHAYYRAFFEEGLNWAPPGVVVPYGVAAGSGAAPAEVSGWPEAAADAWAWASWHVGERGGQAALVAVAVSAQVSEDLAGAIRWVNARNPTDELRREAVTLVAAPGWGSGGASRLQAVDPGVSAFLGALPPAAVVPVAKELAVSCVEDSYAEDSPALLEAVGVLRRSEPFGAELAGRVRDVVRQAAWELGEWRESVAQLGLEERAGAVQACFEPFSMLVAGVSVLIASATAGARSEAQARMALSDLGYERLAVGGDLDLVQGLVERAKRLAWKDARR